MTLPAHVLERLPDALTRGSARLFLPANESTETDANALSLGAPFDDLLPDGGLPRGAITELSGEGSASLSTSIALQACRAAQVEASAHSDLSADALSGAGWCAFLDPSATLYAPGVERAGVVLDRLLVVRPSLEALSRVALRVADSRVFSVIVIDTVGAPGARLDLSLGAWPRIVRRLGVAVEKTHASVLLLTDKDAARPLPLPVAVRVELQRNCQSTFTASVAKEKFGRLRSPQTFEWRGEGFRAFDSRSVEAQPRLRPRLALDASREESSRHVSA